MCCAHYWRGPAFWGTETGAIADLVLEDIDKWRKGATSPGKLFLAGHSRGGAAVIFATNQLNQRDPVIKVDAIFLFDAVDQTPTVFCGADKVPGSVEHCFHALRDPSLAFYYSDGVRSARDKVARCIGLPEGRRTEDLLNFAMKPPIMPGSPCAALILAAQKISEQDYKMKSVMRSVTLKTPDGWSVNFGNCGLESDPKCKLLTEKFLGSHGALGGAPIVDQRAPKLLIEADRAAMSSVWSWMSGHLSQQRAFQR